MQTETYIILGGLLAGWAVTSFFFLKAMKRAYKRGVSVGLVERNDLHSQRLAALDRDVAHLNRLRETEQAGHEDALRDAKRRYLELHQQTLTFGTFLKSEDTQLLLDVAHSLQLAQETWTAFPGTEPVRKKANAQQSQIKQLVARALTTLELANHVAKDFTKPHQSTVGGAA
jgi:hypothetical protein